MLIRASSARGDGLPAGASDLVREVIEGSALDGAHNEDAELRSLIAAGEDLPEPGVGVWFRAEAAIYHLLCGRVNAVAEFVAGIVGQSASSYADRLHLAIGWYSAATGQYAAARHHLALAQVSSRVLLADAVLYRVLSETRLSYSACRELDRRLHQSLPGASAARTFEYLDAKAFALRDRGDVRGSLAIRYWLWRRFRGGPPFLAAVSGGRLALLLGELGQFDRALHAVAWAQATVSPQRRLPGAPSEYLRLVRRRLERLASDLAERNPESASRLWRRPRTARANPRLEATDHAASWHVRVTASFAAWNIEWSLWLGELAAARDSRAETGLEDYRQSFTSPESPVVAARVRAVSDTANHNAHALASVCRDFEKMAFPLDEMDALRGLGHLSRDVEPGLLVRYRSLKRIIGSSLRRPLARWCWETALAWDDDPWRSFELESLPGTGASTLRFLAGVVRLEQELLYHLAKPQAGERQPPSSLDPGPPGRALIVFVTTERSIRSFAFYREPSQRLRCIDSGVGPGRRDLRPLIRDLTTMCRDLLPILLPGRPAPESAMERRRDTLRSIAELLRIPEMFDALRPYASRVSIHPDSLLAAVPFAALPDGRGRPLMETFALSIQPFLQRCAPLASSTPVVVAAKVTHASEGYEALSALEKLDCRALIEDSRSDLRFLEPPEGTPVDRDWFGRNLPLATHFLFVGHGVFNEAAIAERQGLVLNPASGDERYSLFDLAGIRTPSLELAALFCCWVGDSQPTPLHWSFGLADAFLRAGAKYVLASLWPAREDFVKDLIPAYYRYMRTMDPEMALQAAQKEMARLGWDAANWAGFVIRRHGTGRERS